MTSEPPVLDLSVGVVGDVPVDVISMLNDAGIETEAVKLDERPDRMPDAFIVGYDNDAELGAAQKIQGWDSTVPVLIHAPDPAAVKRQMLFTPFLGPAVTTIGSADLVQLVETLTEAVTSARKRRGYVETLDEINSVIHTAVSSPSLSSSYLGPLLDFAPIGIVLSDPEGTVLAANPHAESLASELAHPRDTDIRSLFKDQDHAVTSLLSAAGSPVGPMMVHLDGVLGRRYLEATSAPVTDERGTRLLLLLHDVTARVDTQRQMDEVRESLLFQKSLLESQSEALADGVLVVGNSGEMIYFNRRFVEMWNIPQQVVDSRSDEAAVSSVLDKVVDPDSFASRITYLYDHPLERSRDELALKDGRTFDRFSAPVVGEGGQLFGRVWFFHDATEVKKREQALALLAAAAEAASASRDVQHNLEVIGRLVVDHLGDVCLFYLTDEDGAVERVELSHRDLGEQERLRQAVAPFSIDAAAEEGVARVIREGVPILATQADATMMAADVSDPEGLIEIIGKLGISSWMCIPLRTQSQTIGAMSVVSLDSNVRFESEDLELALELGRRVSVGIAMVKVAERERRVAETLQRSLLPQNLATIPGLEIASRYVAGSQGMDVGGDWFELVKLPDKKVLAVIGDVAGKGLRAAAVMGEIRMALRAYSRQTSSATELVDKLNRLVIEGEDAPMATLLCAVIDLREHRVTFVSAGHPPPLVIMPDGRPVFLDGGLRPPLGVSLQIAREAQHELLPGSILVLYTDGLVERRDRAVDEGMTEMLRVASAASHSADSICDALLEAAFVAGDVNDDAAVLAVHLTSFPESGLEMTVRSDPRELSVVRDTIERWLHSRGLAAESIEDVVFAVNEAAANAIEHAYRPGAGTFQVKGDVSQTAVQIEVIDEGRWRDPIESDHGRGLMLIETLMDEVTIEKKEDGTIIRMRKELGPLSEKPPAPATEPATSHRTQHLYTLIELSGELDLARAPMVTEEVLGRIDHDTTRVFLDLSKVSYIDSSGIRMLFRLDQNLSQRRQELVVVVPRGSSLRRVLNLAGVAGSIKIVDQPPDSDKVPDEG